MFDMMKNLNLSFFQKGNNTQNHTNIYDAKIDTSIKRIEKDFNDGNIQQAMDDLSSLLEENSANQKIKYQLMVKKTSFHFSLRKYSHAVELVDTIEKNYHSFLDIRFEEVKLIVLSLYLKEEEFFKLADKIISESSKVLHRVNFELMYYLNSDNIKRAQEIFDELSKEEKESKEISLLGGHIYSNIDFVNANKYYQIALSHEVSYLDRATIIGFYGTDIINKYMNQHILPHGYMESLKLYKETR